LIDVSKEHTFKSFYRFRRLFPEEAAQKPVLVVLCGPSHAGKTTFANRLLKYDRNVAIISPDEIRKRLCIYFGDSKYEGEVWDIYESLKLKALSKGRNVVLDACHISKRARWHGLQGPNGRYRKICIVFDLPWPVIRDRCLKDGRMTLEKVRRTWKAFQREKLTPD